MEGGASLTSLFWEAGPGWRMAASSVLGGGIGPRSFVLNAQVADGYQRMDPHNHLNEIATDAGGTGDGVGMMTAADVTAFGFASDGGVEAIATVGIGRPIWAADRTELDEARLGSPSYGYRPGTINIVVALPALLSDSALVNTVATATEAKVQAVLEAGYPGTGTASDALCVASALPRSTTARQSPEPFGGPRSRWGARTARAVYTAILNSTFQGHPPAP
ncbi:adenosylcobinamide amidohydrolase [Haloactinospora alba]|nr:adenosylcobinamide amidohydrolase [Haloactinospora alba]